MAIGGAGQRRCPETGLAVPECSCKRCLEVMLRQFSPGVFAGEIRVTRQARGPRRDQGGHREAA